MRIGIVSQWRNQGQATLSRHLRDALDELGHETFVLARPTREQHVLPGTIDHGDVWNQPGVEDASRYEIPTDEYLDWAKRHRLEICFFNQNYQWKQLTKLRAAGVKTVGYFVWEWLERSNLADMRAAYDVVYSLNRCTRARYARFGYDSPALFWGLHPELLAVRPTRREGVNFFFPGGLLGPRKPIRAVVAAFRRTRGERLRLVLKAQLESPHADDYDCGDDPRITTIVDDVDQATYYDLFASCQVSLGVSRWEGTGLHFFEAIAFGLPQIVNDVPPMNEHVTHGVDGMLVQSHVVGATKSGVPSHDPDIADLARAIEAYADPDTLERHTRAIAARRDAMPWQRTKDELAALLRAVR